MLIKDIVAALIDPPKPTPPLLRQELLIRLGMWMQNSTRPEELAFGFFASIVRYVSDRCGECPFREWDDQYKNLFTRNIPLELLKKLFLKSDWQSPMFESILLEFPYGLEDLDAIAEAASIFLWYQPPTASKHDAASIRKIHSVFSRRRKCNGRYYSNIRTFGETWRRHRNATALLYVNKYTLGNALMIDPTSERFADRLDVLADDRRKVLTALAQAKWVSEALLAKLHENAARGLRLEIFPASLRSVEPPSQTLTRSTISALHRSRSLF